MSETLTPQFECHACDWTGDADERPTFCPGCGSVYVFGAYGEEEDYEDE